MAIYYGDGSNSTAGRIIQVVSSAFTGTASTSDVSQGGETSIPFTASITPKDNTNKIFVQCQISCDMSTTHASFATLKRQIGGGGYTDPFVGDASGNRHRVTSGMSDHNSSSLRNICFTYLDNPQTTSQVDYGFTVSHNDNGTVHIYFNYHDSDSDHSYSGRGASSIVLMEVAV